jgi:hypothetical protein
MVVGDVYGRPGRLKADMPLAGIPSARGALGVIPSERSDRGI